jgi:hypothetical protein
VFNSSGFLLAGDQDPEGYVDQELGAGEEAGEDEEDADRGGGHSVAAGQSGADSGDDPAGSGTGQRHRDSLLSRGQHSARCVGAVRGESPRPH